MLARVDVHHHILPPEYVRIAGTERIGARAPNGASPSWSPDRSLAEMDRNGIGTAFVSISTPGVWFGDPLQTRDLARRCNEYAADLTANYPGRFGMFACLPLPDMEASLIEANFALDDLKADGIGLLTSYDGRYLGDPGFASLFQELDRQRAVVYVHPTSLDGSHPLDSLEIPAATLEFPFDTTRTIISLIYSDTLTRYPNIKFIFPHAGGVVPFLSGKLDRLSSVIERFRHVRPLEALRRLFYDTALSANTIAMEALRRLVGPDQILLGSDYPFVPTGPKATIDGLASLSWAPTDIAKIERLTAETLFPRLRR